MMLQGRSYHSSLIKISLGEGGHITKLTDTEAGRVAWPRLSEQAAFGRVFTRMHNKVIGSREDEDALATGRQTKGNAS